MTLHPAASANGAAPALDVDTVIEARGLDAGYGRVLVVRGLNLEVRRGEVVALLGPNGAGKTTTLLALSGELPPAAGEVIWKGRAVRTPLYRRAREGMSYLPEGRAVFMRLSVAENLAIGRGAPERALEMFPELRPLLHRRAGLLSGGEQQILALARALAGDPELLVVDELSLGLAPMIVERLIEAIQRAAAAGTAVLFVEQHVHYALEAADRVYVMQRGGVQLSGTATELKSRLIEIEASYLSGAPAEQGRS
jgi:branched-chain amino acid transport system ATP-binding protein